MAWGARPSWPAGHVVTADEADAVLDQIEFVTPTFARKTANQDVTSSTTLVDDVTLSLSVSASATYWVFTHIIYTGATAGDLKIGWSGPSGATFDWNLGGPDSAAASATTSIFSGSNTISGTDTAGTVTGQTFVARPGGILVTSTTAGTFKFRWAQGTSDGTATTVAAGSSMTLLRMA